MQESLDEEVKSVVESINNPSMKEVKGLEDRLYGLEQLMFGARRLIKEQSEMAQVGHLVWPQTSLSTGVLFAGVCAEPGEGQQPARSVCAS